MAYGTYGELQAAILNELNREGDADTVSAIPGWIRLAESDIRREISTRDVTRNTALSLNSAAVTLPTDVGEVESITHNDITRGFSALTLVTPDHLAELKVQFTTTGIPGWYSIVDGVLLLAPEPDTTYTATILYQPQVTPLAAQLDTNWVLTNHPDLYFYGSLLHSIGWLGLDPNGPEVTFWSSRYANAIQGLLKEKRRHEYGGPLVAMPRRAIGG